MTHHRYTPSLLVLGIRRAPAWLLPALLTACDLPQGVAQRHTDPIVPSLLYVDADGEPITDRTPDDATLYKHTSTGDVPVLDPGGAEVTWGEFSRADGTAELICVGDRTAVNLTMRGLIPEGVYTAWLVFFDPPGFAEVGFEALAGYGPVGPQDGSAATFVADGGGRGQLGVSVPVVPLSVSVSRPGFEIPACLSDAYELHVVAAYHIDGRTYGPVPGDEAVVAEHLTWVFTGSV